MGANLEDMITTLEQELITSQPDLAVVVENDSLVLRGPFKLVKDGYHFDTYEIEVQIPALDLHQIPVVKEVGGRIPKKPDRHINYDGTACLFLPDERFRLCPPGTRIPAFLAGPVWNYFYSQSYFEECGTWPFGEHRHGLEGVLDFYSELTGMTEPLSILKLLSYLVAKKVKPHWSCYCGSGARLTTCHLEVLTHCHDTILRRDAMKSYQLLKSTLPMHRSWLDEKNSQPKRNKNSLPDLAKTFPIFSKK